MFKTDQTEVAPDMKVFSGHDFEKTTTYKYTLLSQT